MIEGQCAANLRVRRHRPAFDILALLLDDIRHTPIRHQTGRDLHDQPAQVAHRPDDPHEHPHHGDICADGDFAAHGHCRAHRLHQDSLARAEDVGERPVERVHDEQLLTQTIAFPVFAVELVDLVGLAGKRFDDAHAGQVLLQHR